MTIDHDVQFPRPRLDSSLFNLDSSGPARPSDPSPFALRDEPPDEQQHCSDQQDSPEAEPQPTYQTHEFDEQRYSWGEVNKKLGSALGKGDLRERQRLDEELIAQSEFNRLWIESHEFSKRTSQEVIDVQLQQGEFDFEVVRDPAGRKEIDSYLDSSLPPSCQSRPIEQLILDSRACARYENEEMAEELLEALIQEFSEQLYSTRRFGNDLLGAAKDFIPFRTDIETIEEFLLALAEFILSEPAVRARVTRNITEQVLPFPAEILKVIQMGDLYVDSNQDCEYQVIPLEVIEDFEAELHRRDTYALSQERFTEQLLKKLADSRGLKYWFYRVIFDCYNYSLDSQRPFGHKGRPMPWLNSERTIGRRERPLPVKLAAARKEVLEQAQVQCGLMLTEAEQQELMIPMDNSLQQLEELRQARVIVAYIGEVQQEWSSTQEEQTEIGLELTRAVLLWLVQELEQELMEF